MNHYTVLGLEQGASANEIALAYRNALDELRALAGRGETADGHRLDALRAAWRDLGDPVRRSAYDAANGYGVPTREVQPATSASRQAEEPHGLRQLGFQFTGKGGEYFRIWIINLLLSVVTLGIYSAWAKVRREQYFHRHLRIDGTGFDYHGDPKAILKGRAIAVGLLMVLGVADKLGPTVYALTLLALAPAVPWLLVRALRFRTHNASYAGLRFAFVGTTGEAARIILGYGLLAIVTLGVGFPLFLQRLRVFVLGHLRFGKTPFSCEVTAGQYYRIYAMPIVAVVVLGVIAVLAGAVGAAPVGAALLPLGLLAVFLVSRIYLTVRGSNAVWNATSLAGSRFHSDLELRGYLGVAATNAVLLLISLGFYWPWAAMRLARYRAEHMGLALRGSRDELVAGETVGAAAAGDEVAEMFDIDIGA